MENEISMLEMKMEMKEKELEELVKEVEVLQEELIEEAFWIESGMMKKRSRNKVIEGHREKEIQKMDEETLIDEKRREVGDLRSEKEDLLGEILILDEYIEKKRGRREKEMIQMMMMMMTKQQKNENWQVSLLNCMKHSQTILNIFFLFLMSNVLFFIFAE